MKIQKVFHVIKCLKENFEEYKCYNLYKSLENAEIFLKRINDINFKIDEGVYKYLHLKKITSDEGFGKEIKDSFKEIASINIKDCKRGINLSAFENKNFDNLKELTLEKDNCNNISPLFSCEFPVLEILNLEDNGIDNTIIDLLKKLNLPELKHLNLYSNKITDLKTPEAIKKFKKLKLFFIGENKIDIYKNPKVNGRIWNDRKSRRR